MMTDFYEAFNNNEQNKDIPKEVLDELNKELPDNLVYFQEGNGKYHVVPKADRVNKEIRMTTQFDLDSDKDSLLIERLKNLPREKWPEYIYRTQKSIPVKNIKIGNDEQLVKIEQTIGNPLSDTLPVVKDCRMYPEKFSAPIPVTFEIEEGKSIIINFQQQAYDSFEDVKISNIDFPALTIDLYIYDPLIEMDEEEVDNHDNNQGRITYSVNPKKAATVSDAIDAMRMFKGILSGTIKVNGKKLLSSPIRANYDPQEMEDAMSFWLIAKKLEKKLGVQFKPEAEFPMDDVEFFYELNICLNENKKIAWKHPLDHFHVTGYNQKNNSIDVDSIIGKEDVHFSFMEGPFSCTLLGTEFDIYCYTEMTDIMITNIEWDDEEKKSGEVYVTDAPSKVWELKRLYLTKEDADKMEKERKID